MTIYTGDDMLPDPTQIFPPDNERKVVLVVHDECIIYSNDATRIRWISVDDEGT
jgi:hypothetical protein